MDPSQLTPAAYTPFADLDLLLSEEEQDVLAAPAEDTPLTEPDTVDAFNAQILAGLVQP